MYSFYIACIRYSVVLDNIACPMGETDDSIKVDGHPGNKCMDNESREETMPKIKKQRT